MKKIVLTYALALFSLAAWAQEEVQFIVTLDSVFVTAYKMACFDYSRCGSNDPVRLRLIEPAEVAVSQQTPENAPALSFAETSVSLQVYPNPTSGAFSVQTGEATGIIRLVSAEGRVLQQAEINNTLTPMDLGNLPAATYFLYYENQNTGKAVTPLVKIRR